MSTLKVNTINAATSGQAVDVDIKSPKSFRNLVINGQFQIWQRKTDSGAGQTSAAYIADRWQINASGGTYQCTRQAFTEAQTDVPSYPQYYHRLSVTTGANDIGPRQRIENVRSVQGEHTLSFWARGTNPAGGHVDAHTKQNFGSGGSTEIETILGQIVLNANSDTWTKYTFTFTPTSLAGKTIGDDSYFQITFKQPSDDTGTAAWSIDIANVQLEKGSSPSDYEQRSYGDELARCQRYCLVIKADNADYTGFNCIMVTDSNAICTRQIPVAMRTVPSYTGSNTDVVVQAGNSTNTVHFNDWIVIRMPTTDNPTTISIRDDNIGGGSSGQAGLLQAKENNGSMIFEAEFTN